MIIKRICIFALAFIQYVFIHSCRSTWSYVSGKMSQPGDNNYFNSQYLGYINFAFLLSYGISISALGQIGDRMSLKIFVLIGGFATSLVFCSIGFFLHYEYRHPYLFLVLQVLNGIAQSAEWPGLLGIILIHFQIIVAILNNWFDEQNKIIILGFFSASPCVGNIVGDFYSGSLVGKDDLPYYTPIYLSGVSLFIICLINSFFLENKPKLEDLESLEIQQQSMQISLVPIKQNSNNTSDSGEYSLPSSKLNKSLISTDTTLSYFQAWSVPNVTTYALAFGCVKAVYYILGFWLPSYLISKDIQDVAWITAMTDLGAAPGGIIVWYNLKQSSLIGFYSRKRAVLQVPCFWIGTVIMICINYAGSLSVAGYMILVFFTGLFIGGIYNNISTAITVELSNQDELRQNKKATATIVSVIIGYASIFSAINQLIVPMVKSVLFLYCGVMSIIGGLLLIPLLLREVKRQ